MKLVQEIIHFLYHLIKVHLLKDLYGKQEYYLFTNTVALYVVFSGKCTE